MARHPQQPIVMVGKVVRFKQNAIVRHLLDVASAHGCDLNRLAMMDFSQEDRMQLAQLIGYSVSGYGDLGYPSKSSIAEADAAAEILLLKRRKRIGS